MRYFIFIWLGFIGLITSCTKEIELELDEGDQRLVVESWFSTDQKEHEVKLTLSGSYFENGPAEKASGAYVKISGGGDEWIFNEVEPGIYKSSPLAHAKYMTEYTMTIQYGGVTYTAKDYCDTVPSMDDFMVFPNIQDGVLKNYVCLIWSYEAEGYGDYYAWRILKNGSYVTDTLTDITFASDDYIGDGLYFDGWPIDYLDKDLISTGDTITMEQHALSQNAYDAYLAIMQETEWRGGIFDAPPANVPSNFDNNAMGLFVVSSMHKLNYIVP